MNVCVSEIETKLFLLFMNGIQNQAFLFLFNYVECAKKNYLGNVKLGMKHFQITK